MYYVVLARFLLNVDAVLRDDSWYPEELLTHFRPILLSMSLQNVRKPSENLWFSDIFRGYKKGTLGCNGLSECKNMNLLFPLENLAYRKISQPLLNERGMCWVRENTLSNNTTWLQSVCDIRRLLAYIIEKQS